jgi:multidrug efflux pump subunit AcrA (membrane-fusion protein)
MLHQESEVAKHRSAEEIEAAKAEAARKKAERLDARQGKCVAVYKLPCLGKCSRGCKRAATARELAKAKKARREQARQSRQASLAQATRAQEEAYQAEIAAIKFEMKARKSKLLDLERWQASVMYLCGFTVDEINKEIGGNKRRGPINRVVTNGKLEAARQGLQRIKRLADLASKPPYGMEGFALYWAARGEPRGLHRDLERFIAIKPEFKPMQQKLRGGGERIWNPAASALHAEASAGGIEEYCLQAGVWLSSLFDRIGAGGVRGFDPTRDQVDGSGAGGTAEATVDALRIETMVRDHVLAAFRPDGTAEWRWRVIEHVVRLDRPLADAALPAALGSPSRFLNDALEEVALCRNMAPAGIRSRRPGGVLDFAYEEAARLESDAVRSHYVMRWQERRKASGD